MPNWDAHAHWLDDLHRFFEQRSRSVRGRRRPSREALCYISGREPRLWRDAAVYADLIDSIRAQLDLSPRQAVLEVGCAAGFLAEGLAGATTRYVGLDLSRAALGVARLLGLERAAFVQGDGTALPFGSETFDRVVSYDVFTNIPEWNVAAALIREMVRVVKRGGRVLVGSLADERKRDDYPNVVVRVGAELDARFGPLVTPGRGRRLWSRWLERRPEPEGQIVCYYFRPEDLLGMGVELHVECDIVPIHSRNPYRDFRFSVVYRKPPA